MERLLTLHFIDGSKISLEFPEQAPNVAAKQIKLADFLASKHLIVQAEGSVLIFPVGNIKYMSMTLPVLDPKKMHPTLPRQAILDARIVS